MVIVKENISIGDKELLYEWPIELGLLAGTTKQEGTKLFLQSECKSLVTKEQQKGLY